MYALSLILNFNIKCYRCEKGHLASKCTFSGEIECKDCGIKLQAICFQNWEAHQLNKILTLEHAENRKKFYGPLKINNIPVTFEIDSDVVVTIIIYKQAMCLFTNATLYNTDIQLSTYLEHEVKIEGYIIVTV